MRKEKGDGHPTDRDRNRHAEQPGIPGAPVAEVVIGPEEGLPIGVVHVAVPAGGAMPEHDHGPSTTLLISIPASAELVDVGAGGHVTRLEPGNVTVIPVGRGVRLENPTGGEARLPAALSPPDLPDRINDWPAAERR